MTMVALPKCADMPIRSTERGRKHTSETTPSIGLRQPCVKVALRVGEIDGHQCLDARIERARGSDHALWQGSYGKRQTRGQHRPCCQYDATNERHAEMCRAQMCACRDEII